jgi:fibronectin type 3 domain-containing protein
MKRCFASLFAVGIVATLMVVGCGDSATVSQPDTAPPLAPVVLGARGSDGMVGLWWRGNTEPDLAGYHIYITQGGLTQRMNRYPIENTYVSWVAESDESLQLYVTAVDWTGNESSPSVTKMVDPTRDGQDKLPVEGLDHKELSQPR